MAEQLSLNVTENAIAPRPTGSGLEGLTDRSRRPYRHANRLPFQIETLIVQLKKEHPSWGAPKIREKIRRLHTCLGLRTIRASLSSCAPVNWRARSISIALPRRHDRSRRPHRAH
jgi:putative transposase